MKHTFSTEFLKIAPPATNFGEAWECLCLKLLQTETFDHTIYRLAPPDRGVDILRANTGAAYQCKSNERGIFGTIDAEECIASLNRAIGAQADIGWQEYSIALNAPLTGNGLSKINSYSDLAKIARPKILAPDYWAELCEKHKEHIMDYFDYRVFVTEAQIIEALEKARYYDSVITQARESIRLSPLQVRLTNNRTPIELEIPFGSDLTIEKLLDVAQQLLGISLDWANFPDLGTSCGPSLSLTIDKVPQAFKLKLSELSEEQRAKLQLWIKLVWHDELQKEHEHFDGTARYMCLMSLSRRHHSGLCPQHERGKETIVRMETLIQESIWQAVSVSKFSNAG